MVIVLKKIVVLGDTLVSKEPLGIQRFAYEILLELDKMQRDYRIEVLIPNGVTCNLALKSISIIRYGSYASPFLWRQFVFPTYVKMQKALGVDFTLGLPVLGCDIVGIFDCIHENFPKDFVSVKDKIKRLSYLIRARIVVKRARKVITISEYSKKEILEYYKMPMERISIISCGWQHFNRIESDTGILQRLETVGKEFIFALGSSLPHKNFEWIIRAAKRNPQYLFVVTGTNRLSSYQDKLDISGLSNILFTGFLKDAEIKALMEKCIAFVHPSLYEGFGIPPLEALSCGAKVFVSDATCLPEVFGEAVVYFKPEDMEMDINVLLRKSVGDATEILRKYDWRRSANELHMIFQKL